jgi:hypothetical protein
MPNVIVISGANGAGKSTLAPFLLRDTFGILEYVNADTIAEGLSAFAPEAAAFDAGRIMLERLGNSPSSAKISLLKRRSPAVLMRNGSPVCSLPVIIFISFICGLKVRNWQSSVSANGFAPEVTTFPKRPLNDDTNADGTISTIYISRLPIRGKFSTLPVRLRKR